MIDSHVHLDASHFDEDREDVIGRARDAGIEAMINIGIDVPSSEASVELSRKNASRLPIFVAVGLHPQSPIDDLDAALQTIRRLALEEQERVVAIGEIGLDFYWDTVSREQQEQRLERQLEISLELQLPVIYHCRNAIDALLESLERRGRVPAGVFHCFEGDATHARRALDLGYHISFAGNVTYKKKSEHLQEAARVVPTDRLLLETDCPYLSPHPRRGERNEPAFAILTRDFLAELKEMTAEGLDESSRHATVRLFGLDLPD